MIQSQLTIKYNNMKLISNELIGKENTLMVIFTCNAKAPSTKQIKLQVVILKSEFLRQNILEFFFIENVNNTKPWYSLERGPYDTKKSTI